MLTAKKILAGTVLAVLFASFFSRRVDATDFGSPTSYPVGTGPTAIVVGDFNGDGKPDLAVANTVSSDVSILINNGDGTFKAAVNSPAGTAPQAMAAGDLNGDGKLDLVVINEGDPSTGVNGVVFLLLGNKDGTFQAPVQLQADRFPLSIAVADLNGDNKLDVILGDGANDGVTILLGKGDGTFQPPNAVILGSSGAVGALGVGDFNADKNVDIVAAVSVGPVFILLGKGDGTFQPAVQIATSATSPHLLAADFNGDGRLDVVLRSETRPTFPCRPFPFFCFTFDRVTFYSGNGDGTFNAGTSVFSLFRASPGNLVAGDFNADGKQDLLVARFGSGLLYLGHGDGTFVPVPPALWSGLGPFVAAADFNGDPLPLPDLAVTDGTNNAVVVFLNTSPTSGADLAVTVNPTQADVTIGGGDLSYTATVFNEGPQDASGVTLTEALPASLKFVSAQPSQGTCTGTTTITCDLGAMADPSSASVQFTVTPMAPGTFSDSLTVAATEPDLNLKNNTASITVTAVLPADIAVSGTASEATGAIGDKVTYTVTVSNSGPATATTVSMTDSLSDNLPVSSLTTSQGSCTTAPSNITCALGTLAAGASVIISFVITLQTAEFFTNNLGVTADQPDLNTANNGAVVTVTVNPADLSVTETELPSPVLTGTAVTYTITVSNKGPTTANNVMLSDSLPQLVNVSPATASQGSCSAASNGQITCSLGALAASAKATVSVGVTPTATGQMVNGVSVSANEPDPDTSNNSATLTTDVGVAPDFTLTATSTSLSLRRGGSVNDTITIAAQGNFSGNVQLTCAVSGTSPAPTCSISPSSVLPGASATLVVSAANLTAQALPGPLRHGPLYAALLPFLALAGLSGVPRKLKLRRGGFLLLFGMALSLLTLQAGCGGGSSTPPPSENFTVTVTGTDTSGSLKHTTQVTVTVQ